MKLSKNQITYIKNALNLYGEECKALQKNTMSANLHEFLDNEIEVAEGLVFIFDEYDILIQSKEDTFEQDKRNRIQELINSRKLREINSK